MVCLMGTSEFNEGLVLENPESSWVELALLDLKEGREDSARIFAFARNDWGRTYSNVAQETLASEVPAPWRSVSRGADGART